MKQALVTGAASPEGIGWATALGLAEDGYEVIVTGLSTAELERTPQHPSIRSVVLEYPSSNGPYGVKGVGEMTANSPIPAIVNAIYDAAGVWITDLPVTPEKVLRALEAEN